jgi:glutamate-5-semialdehyde dehydrogenase
LNADLHPQNIGELMETLGKAALSAASVLALAGTDKKNAALHVAAEAIRARRDDILAANAHDMSAARTAKLSGALLDRLHLDEKRVEASPGALKTYWRWPIRSGRPWRTGTGQMA